MKLIVKDMDIATGGVLIVILNQNDADKMDLHSGDRILLKKNKKEITCVLDISESKKAVPEGKIGLFEEVLSRIKVKDGDKIEINMTGKPQSVSHIRDKLFGKELNYEEIYHIIDDITNDRLTDIEKTYFVSAGFSKGWSIEEIVHLTKAMVKTGEKLEFDGGIVLDKHCIGGVPGNRTTMIVVPIVAAAGFIIPKTSSRAITSPAGTADTMECLAQVEISEKKIKEIIHKIGACIVHGGSINLAPADDKIIDVENPLSIDAEGQLISSVMAKKYSVSASHVLIDIPMGEKVKAKNPKHAHRLKKMFEIVGKKLGMDIKVVITDGSQPIGNGIGPLLEAEDVIAVLRNDPHAPTDLRNKSLMLAGMMLEMTKKYSPGTGKKIAKNILESGMAYKKMQEIIKAQGRTNHLCLSKFKHDVHSGKSGKIKKIDNEMIIKLARIAGAPKEKCAGLYLHKKVGANVKKGETLFTIYAQNEFELDLANELLKKGNGYNIS